MFTRSLRALGILLLPLLLMVLVIALNLTPVSLAGPQNTLSIVSLDSTLSVTWTPPVYNGLTWQTLIIRTSDGTVQQTKVVSKTATAAQANGLVPGNTYDVAVYGVDTAGALTLVGETTATTDPQSPMCQPGFFENFNEAQGGLDSNYFDQRTDATVSAPDDSILDERQIFNSENHFHTQLVATTGHVEEYLRPRVPFDISGGRVGTMQFEVDMPAAQRGHGKWFSVMFSKNLPFSASEFGDNADDAYPSSVGFTVRSQTGADDSQGAAALNNGTVQYNDHGISHEYFPSTLSPHFTPANVRVPVVIKVSQTYGELWINGVLDIHQNWPQPLDFTTGYWEITQRNYYAQRWFNDFPRSPTMVDQLIHWDTVSFDAPAPSYNPIVRSYLQPGCPGMVNLMGANIQNCSQVSLGSGGYHFTFNITDTVGLVRSARLLFNGGSGHNVTVNVNGLGSVVVTGTGAIYNKLNSVAINPLWLVQGNNTITLTAANSTAAQVELETVWNEPRTIPIPDEHIGPMLNVTTNNIRVDRIASDPTVLTATSALYSLGADTNQPFTATIVTNSPWLTVTPMNGILHSLASGGQVIPITMRINTSVLGHTDDDGVTAIIKFSDGLPGVMQAYIGLLIVNDGSTTAPVFITSFTPLTTVYNKAAVPDYHGCPAITATPTLPTTNTPTPLPTVTPTYTIIPTVTPIPTATEIPTNTPIPTDTPAPTVTPTPIAITCYQYWDGHIECP